MATATQTPEAPAQQQPQAESNTTSERTDYIVGHNVIKTKDEKTGAEVTSKEPAFYDVSKEEFQNDLKKMIEEGKFVQSYQVTVSIPRAKNFVGIREICPDENEAAMNFNRGAKQKANNRLKAKLLEINEDTKEFTWLPDGVDEDGKPNLTNGVLDMTSEIASPSKKKNLTEEEKLDRFLEQFPEATRQMMKSAYLASRQAPAQPIAA